LGTEVRFDAIDNALYHAEARERLSDKVKASIDESQIGAYIEEDARVRRWLRFVVAARGQRIDVEVEDQIEDRKTTGNKTSGVKGAMLFLPKVMTIVSPIPALDLFADWGRGFHSNDARGVVQAAHAATLMTPATGYEIGARVSPIRGLSLSA